MGDTLSLKFTFADPSGNVEIPISGPFLVVVVDWGDGSPVSGLNHTYSLAGTYTAVVSIFGSATSFGSDGWAGVANLTDVSTNNVSTWGLGSPASVTSFANLFKGALLLTSVPTDIPPSIQFVNSMFLDASSFNQDISGWSVNSVTDMTDMFRRASAFNNGGVALSWGIKTGNVTIMRGMFADAINFDQDISGWDVSKVTNMSAMFGTTSFNNGGVALSWDSKTGNVTNMDGMFFNNASFNQPIGGWDVSKVTTMVNMFLGASAFNQDIHLWDVSSVTNMLQIFLDATAFNSVLTYWDTGNVTDMTGMFDGALAFNQAIGAWNVSKVTTMVNMFTNAISFNQDIHLWDVSHVTTMLLMFAGATSFNKNLSAWDVGLVTNTSNMFAGATAFNNGGAALSWGNKTRNFSIMSGMFSGATAFNQAISDWNVGRATLMEGMFQDAILFNQDIGDWNVSRVINMKLMFNGAPAFNQDISGWDVSSVTTMDQMFQNDASFNQNIRGWAVLSGTNLSNMFNGANAFQTAFYRTTPGYDTDPNTPLYTFFNYTPPPPTPKVPVPRLAVGGGGGAFWFGMDGFLYKRKGGGGGRRSTKMAPGGNTTCNGPTYIYNKYNPGNTGIGAQSTAVRRAKNIKAAVCGPKIPCGQFYNYLGLYDNYTGNPNGYVIYPRPNF